MKIVLPSETNSNWLTDLPAGKRNARSSRSTLISYFGLRSVTSRGEGLSDIIEHTHPIEKNSRMVRFRCRWSNLIVSFHYGRSQGAGYKPHLRVRSTRQG